MTDVIDYRIVGEDMQLVEIELDPHEGVRAEVGAMMYMDQGIEMQTTAGGGISKAFKRDKNHGFGRVGGTSSVAFWEETSHFRTCHLIYLF